MKDEFIKLFTENIHRDGADKLLAWLESCDFFTAPASVKYHSNYEGGLCEHSVNVYKRLKDLLAFEYDGENNPPYVLETVAICGLLHDVCKANFYKVSTRNVKNEETGAWEKVPYYAVEDQLPYGHGEKSVYIISGFMRLSREEAFAIRWHMGLTGDFKQDELCSKSYGKFLLALMLHIADLEATFIDEKDGN